MGHHEGFKKGKPEKQNSLISPLSAILCNDIIACYSNSNCLNSNLSRCGYLRCVKIHWELEYRIFSNFGWLNGLHLKADNLRGPVLWQNSIWWVINVTGRWCTGQQPLASLSCCPPFVSGIDWEYSSNLSLIRKRAKRRPDITVETTFSWVLNLFRTLPYRIQTSKSFDFKYLVFEPQLW